MCSRATKRRTTPATRMRTYLRTITGTAGHSDPCSYVCSKGRLAGMPISGELSTPTDDVSSPQSSWQSICRHENTQKDKPSEQPVDAPVDIVSMRSTYSSGTTRGLCEFIHTVRVWYHAQTTVLTTFELMIFNLAMTRMS